MKICVKNFKGVDNFEFETNQSNILVLTGENSGGKSSFIQSILLMAQSISEGQSASPIVCDGGLIRLGNPRTLINNYAKKNKLGISYTFSGDMGFLLTPLNRSRFFRNTYIRRLREKDRTSNSNSYYTFLTKFAKCEYLVTIELKESDGRLIISSLSYEVNLPESTSTAFINFKYKRRLSEDSIKYEVSTNHPLFLHNFPYLGRSNNEPIYEAITNGGLVLAKSDFERVAFQKMIPITSSKDLSSGLSVNAIIDGESISRSNFQIDFENSLIELLQNDINQYFDSITYIGPLRQRPESIYIMKENVLNSIGVSGENTVTLLAQNKEKMVTCPIFGQIITSKKMKLIDAVNYWMCEMFGLSDRIKVEPRLYKEVIKIQFISRNNTLISFNNVGFGISQILPIIVHGLNCDEKKTIILEQPEIHLHPKMQSVLFDFIRAISSTKKVIVETHSDHFINRMRRRVIEDESGSLGKHIDLVFAEKGKFTRIKLDEYGCFDKWPEGFFDQDDIELHEILIARAHKQQKVKKNE